LGGWLVWGSNTKNNVIKTDDLRVDLHKDSSDENKAVAKLQANTQAKDQGVKDYIKSRGNQGGVGI